MTITLKQIQERAYTTAKSKGWHDKPLRQVYPQRESIDHDRVLRMHALMHSELTEAHDEIANGRDGLYWGNGGKPEGLPAEIADFVIRVCDTTAALGLVLRPRAQTVVYCWWSEAKRMFASQEIPQSPCGARQDRTLYCLGLARAYVDRATEAVRVDDWEAYAECLTLAVLYAASIAAGYGQDLPAVIEAKMTYNETRPYRHGGKQA